MPDPAKSRPYRQGARAATAAATRQRILDAAEGLFLQRGFGGTTTKALAQAAGVSEKTVFLTFPGKAALLSELVRIRVRGDEPDAAAARSDAWQAMLAASDDALIPRFAVEVSGQLARSARILVVAEAAALDDPELAARRTLGHTAHRATVASFAEELARRGLVRADAVQGLTDALFALTIETVYLRLTEDCGWSREDYASWLARMARAAVEGPAA